MDVALVDVRVVEVVDNTVGVVHVLVVDVLEDNVDVLVVDVTLVDFEVTNDDVVLVVCQRLREETHKACDESSLGGGAWNWTFRAERRYLDPKREHPTMSMVAHHLVHLNSHLEVYIVRHTHRAGEKKHDQC